MKYIKEYSQIYEDNNFSESEVDELRDVYLDIIDDLDLYDNKYQIYNIDDSTFREPSKSLGFDKCKIYIRTIVSYQIFSQRGDVRIITDGEGIKKHNKKLDLLAPHLERIKRMGYKLEVKNLIGQNADIINGIEIIITKKTGIEPFPFL